MSKGLWGQGSRSPTSPGQWEMLRGHPAPSPRTGLYSKLSAVLTREVPGANGGREREERTEPAGAEGQAQEGKVPEAASMS